MEELKYTKEKSRFLAKWLRILFWLVIPGILANLLTNENIVNLAPVLYWPGQILSVLYSLAYGYVLLKLASENSHYRSSGICWIVSAAVSLISLVFSVMSPDTGEISPAALAWVLLSLVFSVVLLVIGLVGEYQEYKGHSELLRGVDDLLSEKWLHLWKGYIILFVVIIVSVFLVFISLVLGVLGVIVSIVGALIISVLKLVYLYSQAKRFESMAETEL